MDGIRIHQSTGTREEITLEPPRKKKRYSIRKRMLRIKANKHFNQKDHHIILPPMTQVASFTCYSDCPDCPTPHSLDAHIEFLRQYDYHSTETNSSDRESDMTDSPVPTATSTQPKPCATIPPRTPYKQRLLSWSMKTAMTAIKHYQKGKALPIDTRNKFIVGTIHALNMAHIGIPYLPRDEILDVKVIPWSHEDVWTWIDYVAPYPEDAHPDCVTRQARVRRALHTKTRCLTISPYPEYIILRYYALLWNILTNGDQDKQDIIIRSTFRFPIALPPLIPGGITEDELYDLYYFWLESALIIEGNGTDILRNTDFKLAHYKEPWYTPARLHIIRCRYETPEIHPLPSDQLMMDQHGAQSPTPSQTINPGAPVSTEASDLESYHTSTDLESETSGNKLIQSRKRMALRKDKQYSRSRRILNLSSNTDKIMNTKDVHILFPSERDSDSTCYSPCFSDEEPHTFKTHKEAVLGHTRRSTDDFSTDSEEDFRPAYRKPNYDKTFRANLLLRKPTYNQKDIDIFFPSDKDSSDICSSDCNIRYKPHEYAAHKLHFRKRQYDAAEAYSTDSTADVKTQNWDHKGYTPDKFKAYSRHRTTEAANTVRINAWVANYNMDNPQTGPDYLQGHKLSVYGPPPESFELQRKREEMLVTFPTMGQALNLNAPPPTIFLPLEPAITPNRLEELHPKEHTYKKVATNGFYTDADVKLLIPDDRHYDSDCSSYCVSEATHTYGDHRAHLNRYRYCHDSKGKYQLPPPESWILPL